MDQRTANDLKESAASLTMHGFGRLLSTKSKAMRCIWLLLMLFFVSLVILTVMPTVRRYFKSPSLTKVETVRVSEMKMPAITVCGPTLSKYRVKQFAEKSNITLEKDKHGQISNLEEILSKYDSPAKLAYDTRTFIINPKSGLERLGIEYRGYCYKINSNGTFIQRTAGPDRSLEIVLFLNVSDGMSISSRQPGDSVEVIIQDHKQFPSVDSGTVLAPVGHLTQIEVKKTEIRRLKSPYPSKCTNGENMKLLFKGEYTINNCRLSCFLSKVVHKCKTIYHFYNLLLPKKMRKPPSSREDDFLCQNNIEKTLRSEEYASCGCRLPCNEIRFRKSASFSKWPSTQDIAWERVSLGFEIGLNKSNLTEKFVRDNFIAINVFFGDMEYQKITEIPMYTLDKLIGEIGGQMGIWVGASIFSLLELIYLFVLFVRFSWRKKRAFNLDKSSAVEEQ
ncbi:amiloride-sensitive sodium channel subunit beta-like [Rhopilema esculentum]|uniref:amiloride-sensitive sodium channel subunit beta-like n=1 Tax=Rhopilema esculentum TaxID=499914 RepID=UPI0031E1D2C8|eukprot:gene11436-21637_t